MASPSTSTSVPAVEERPEGPGDELQMRKRRDETQWKRNLAKRKRNSGQEYVGLSINTYQSACTNIKLSALHTVSHSRSSKLW